MLSKVLNTHSEIILSYRIKEFEQFGELFRRDRGFGDPLIFYYITFVQNVRSSRKYLSVGSFTSIEIRLQQSALGLYGRGACPEMIYFNKHLLPGIIKKHFPVFVATKEARTGRRAL
ncbi:MAG: hypothetical protein JW882_17175 [Deltaproteobacteria bacterium]|nr:hypothetical protein [Deltaproteobacteria bacterium]